MAGFSHERAGLYHLKRAIAEPPQSLQRHIWPWLDEAAQMYALGYASGQGSDLDQFVKLLLELRVVLLQDSALLMPWFPKLPLWKHPVFSHDD
jgi:Centromere DNA-binding protein complex CBF3 subunit, domain 2